MYEELFDDVHLTVVEQPIDWVRELPLYRGHIKEQYQEYAALNQVEDKEEDMTSSLLTPEQLLKYYDGETFDGFSLGDLLKDE